MSANYYFNDRSAVDRVGPDGRGCFTLKTKEELEAVYGALTELTLDDLRVAIDNAASSAPEAIDEREFINALECLPPLRWKGATGGWESFRISEAFDGSVHWSYVRCGSRFFKLRQPLARTHDELCQLVAAAFPEVRA